MKRMTLTLAVALVMVVCSGALYAQDAQSDAKKPAATPAAKRPVTPDMARVDMTRSVPCIVPTLRLISPQMVQTLALRLELTDDQKKKITAVLEKADKDIKLKTEAQAKAGQSYVELLISPTATKAQIMAAAEKTMKTETDVLMARIDALFEMKALLTGEQNKLLGDRLTQYTFPWRDSGNMPPAPPVPSNAPPK